MKKYTAAALMLLTSIVIDVNAQESTEEGRGDSKRSSLVNNKGNFFFYWGYNRSVYAKSDIHLIGEDYNFSLSGVEAKDLPEELSATYFNPLKLTIPQFNIRVGYFINERYAISAGWDHMKYRSVNGSQATIDGYIGDSISSVYAGTYDRHLITMDDIGLVKMEHSDGLNIVNINLARKDFLTDFRSKKWDVNLVSEVGIGIAIPWTNSIVFGVKNDDRPHFSGLGSQFAIAPELIFNNSIFIRFVGQFGFVNMWDIAIKPKGDHSAHAEQIICYYEQSVVFGYQFKVFK